MAFQFVHLEGYSRKADKSGRSVAWVLDEAARVPGAAGHVAQPQPPEILHGVDVEGVRRLHDEAVARATVALPNGRTRAIRRDQKTLLTIVASHPASMDQVRDDPRIAADVRAWEARTLSWLRDQYGDALVSVVRHVDEAHAHLHAFVIPSDLRVMRLHPGAEAKRAVLDAGPLPDEDSKTLNKRGDRAYRAAMRGWQDGYSERVGLPSGLARVGPGRRRLTRAAWQAEKSAAASLKAAAEKAARIDRQASAFVVRTKARAAEIVHEAETVRDAAAVDRQKAKSVLSRARSEASRILDVARSDALRLSSWGTRIRSFFDGFRQSSVLDAARHEASRGVTTERERADELARRLSDETRRRQEAEQRARNAAVSVQSLGLERDLARRRLTALQPQEPRSRIDAEYRS